MGNELRADLESQGMHSALPAGAPADAGLEKRSNWKFTIDRDMQKGTASGVKLDRAERKRVIAPVQRREIDAVLVTELSRA